MHRPYVKCPINLLGPSSPNFLSHNLPNEEFWKDEVTKTQVYPDHSWAKSLQQALRVFKLIVCLFVFLLWNIVYWTTRLKGRGTRGQIANICWIIEKAREFQRNIYFSFIDYEKAYDCMDHKKLENS